SAATALFVLVSTGCGDEASQPATDSGSEDGARDTPLDGSVVAPGDAADSAVATFVACPQLDLSSATAISFVIVDGGAPEASGGTLATGLVHPSERTFYVVRGNPLEAGAEPPPATRTGLMLVNPTTLTVTF